MTKRTWRQRQTVAFNPSNAMDPARQASSITLLRYDLVVLDELTYMLAFDYLPEDEVICALTGRPESQSLVVTGRGGGQALREVMDTVSEVKEVKHAYRAGIRARQGVDY